MEQRQTSMVKASPEQISEGARLLKEGKLVVFPTETVYGIGANAENDKAVAEIFKAKGRPQDNPLILHVAKVEQMEPLVQAVTPTARVLLEAFAPGPLTLILPKSSRVSSTVSGGLDTVAVRIPSHRVAHQLLLECRVPVAAPSANRSGSPSPTTAQHVFDDLDGRVDLILDGGHTPGGVESTVLSLVDDVPLLLRPGMVTLEQLREVVGEVNVSPAVLDKLEESEKPQSPGMKYRHYAPKADVTLVHGSTDAFTSYCNDQPQGTWAMAFDEDASGLRIPFRSYGAEKDQHHQAAELFATLRELDNLGAEKILVHAPHAHGIGLAIYNRLLRAASFNEIYLK